MPVFPNSLQFQGHEYASWTQLPEWDWSPPFDLGHWAVEPDSYIGTDSHFLTSPVTFRFGLQQALRNFTLTTPYLSSAEAPEANYYYHLNKLREKLALFDGIQAGGDPIRFGQYIRQLYRDATIVYQKYGLIRSEHQSETVLGHEYFVNLLYQSIKNPSADGAVPVVACIRMPMTDWNKMGGHAVGDIFREGIMAVVRTFFGEADAGQFVYSARVNLGLVFPAGKFEKEHFERLLNSLWQKLEDYLRVYVSSDDALYKGKLRIKKGNLEVYSLTSKSWLAFSSFAHEFKAGVVQTPKLEFSPEDLKKDETRSAIAGLVDSLRNQALSRAEHLAYSKSRKTIDWGEEVLTRTWTEFPQGIYMSPDDVLVSLRNLASGTDRIIVMKLAGDFGLSASLAEEFVRGLATSQAEYVQDLPRVQKDFVNFVYEKLGQSATPTSLHFALKSGLIPRLNHEIGRFSRPNGVLNQMGSYIQVSDRMRDQIEPVGGELTIPDWDWVSSELESLVQLSQQALRELTNAVAIKERFYDESVLAHFQSIADVTADAYVFGIDIDHLKDFFSANRLSPDQLVDQKMIEILSLPQTAFEAYARELGIEAKGFLLKFGDEIIFTFPRKGKKADGTVVEIGPQKYAEKLRQMLREGFARYQFPYTEKIKVGDDVQRMPIYDVYFKDGTKARLACDVVLENNLQGTAQHTIYVLSGLSGKKKTLLNKPTTLAQVFEGKEIFEFERVEGGLDFTIAFTRLTLEQRMQYSFRQAIFNSARKQVLDHTDVMKASGRRSATDYLNISSVMQTTAQLMNMGRESNVLHIQRTEELCLTVKPQGKDIWQEGKKRRRTNVKTDFFGAGAFGFPAQSMPVGMPPIYRHDLNLVVSGEGARAPVNPYAHSLRRQTGQSPRLLPKLVR